jgi:hypothetical protein
LCTIAGRVPLLEISQHGSKIQILLAHGSFHTRSAQGMHVSFALGCRSSNPRDLSEGLVDWYLGVTGLATSPFET